MGGVSMKHMRNGSSVRMALAALVGLGAVAALPTGAQASLLNDPFLLESLTVFGTFNDTATVGAGPEFVAGDTSFFSQALLPLRPASAYFIDVDATGITFFWDFNHQFTYVFTELNWTDMPGTITSVTGSVIFGDGTITATSSAGDEVTAQFDCIATGTDGCGGAGGSQFRIDITAEHPVSAVPLPAALPLFLSALAGLGFVGWRRRHADG